MCEGGSQRRKTVGFCCAGYDDTGAYMHAARRFGAFGMAFKQDF